MPQPVDLQLTRRDWVVGLLIVLLAFAFRAVIIFDRANAPNAISAFDPLPVGSDQTTYYTAIAQYHEGTFPPSTYHYQPGMLWFMVGSSQLLNTASLGILRLFAAALASINVGLFMATARLARGRRAESIIAALLLAIYPVSAFYDTDFVITSQAIILLNLALLGVLVLWRWPRAWIGVVLYGLSFGIIAIMRRELLALAPIFGLWLLWQRPRWRTVIQVGVAAAICVAVLLPVIGHNRSNGADFLITPVTNAEIYRGNNRDANGAYHVGPASLSTSQDYMRYWWLDVKLSPRRYAGLVLHKIGMFLSSHEPGNNLNYMIAGEGTSALLRAVPLDFQILLALFLAGLFVQARRRDPTAVLFAVSFLMVLAAGLLMWIEARTRTPVVVVMMLPAAAALAEIGTAAYDVVQPVRPRRSLLFGLGARRSLLAGGCIGAVLVFGTLAESDLPRKVTVDHLPDTAEAVGAVYDDAVELVGWRIEEQYSRAGIITPFSPYVVTFYWRLLHPTDIDYGFGLLFTIDGQPVIVEDHQIGSVNYPFTLTSSWEPGRIYVEHVGLTYKRFDDARGISGDLLLSVYREWEGDQPLPAVGVEGSRDYLRLAQPAIMYGDSALPEGLPGDQPSTPFGKMLTLAGWQIPAQITAGQPFDVTLGWTTTGQPIRQSYILAVYAFDARQQVVAQADSPPHSGRLLTSSLPAHYRFGDVKTLTLADPGSYTLYAAVYDATTLSRLDVPGSDDDLLRLGEITVQPQEAGG